jgi:hypothetical protein
MNPRDPRGRFEHRAAADIATIVLLKERIAVLDGKIARLFDDKQMLHEQLTKAREEKGRYTRFLVDLLAARRPWWIRMWHPGIFWEIEEVLQSPPQGLTEHLAPNPLRIDFDK